jgi:hypothetical protein
LRSVLERRGGEGQADDGSRCERSDVRVNWDCHWGLDGIDGSFPRKTRVRTGRQGNAHGTGRGNPRWYEEERNTAYGWWKATAVYPARFGCG